MSLIEIICTYQKPSPKEEEDTLTAHPDGSLAADLALEVRCRTLQVINLNYSLKKFIQDYVIKTF